MKDIYYHPFFQPEKAKSMTYKTPLSPSILNLQRTTDSA
jgi:hypothetical protein